MPWTQLTIASTAERTELLTRTLEAAGALAVTLVDAADHPVLEPGPGETPVWPATQVVALFPADTDLAPLQAALSPHLTLTEQRSWCSATLEDQTWERTWLEHFHPLRFGQRLWVCPSDQQPPVTDAVIVRLDPGLAFGTGTHPTTALCLEWLDGTPLTGKTMIDYGCGSGILAVAAAKLGVAAIRAVDIDPQALVATCENAARNAVEQRIDTCLPRDLERTPADLVVANILAGPLAELAPELITLLKPGGDLVLSGLLGSQVSTVQNAYGPAVTWSPPAFQAEWARLHGVRAG
ncbi:MAG: 50S ribosomal protein L11 methyltransferase [Proteobacteria bacterium]|nr:MAG: 50S ribosomal protein L11 methyltransferase [Pseudomonadota bacterium]QKK10257.1 MAG: 50S ribosomal protein L11 methyltransferase [Pseudomonadota bacterium]